MGQLIDLKISLQASDGIIQTLDNGGVSGFIKRGLLHPENHIAAEISESLHRLTISNAAQTDGTGLVGAMSGMNMGDGDQDAEDMEEQGTGGV